MKQDIENLAYEAKNYARKYILEGSTQLKNNDYPEEKRKALYKAVHDVRSKLYEEITDDPYRIESNNLIYEFDKGTAIYSKYSIGNCAELVHFALDYIIRNSNIYAERYTIQGGDHVFLVIGRDLGSDENDPESWGDNAFICDPWANEVYPAYQYASKLKNYYRVYSRLDFLEPNAPLLGNLEDFNRIAHTLVPTLNTNQLHANNRSALIPGLIENYQKKIQIIINALNVLKEYLEDIDKEIESKYSQRNSEHGTLRNRMNRIETMMNELESHKQGKFSYNDYDEAHTQLRQKLKNSVNEFRKVLVIEKGEPRGVNFLTTLTARFFKIPQTNTLSKTHSAILKADDDAIKSLKLFEF